MAKTREKRFRTFPHRWGDGKVHSMYYDSLNRLWVSDCKQHQLSMHGEFVDENEEVTCKKCLRGGP